MIKKLIGASLFYGRFFFSFSRIGYWVRQTGWDDPDPEFADQRWLITGASGGLGLATAEKAYQHGAMITLAARSEKKLAATQSGKEEQRWAICACDLSSREQIDQLVRTLIRKRETLDVLVNNVGIMLHDYEQTPEGIERMFATNLLNHYYLTERLIAAEILRRDSAVINVSSGGQYMAPLMVETLHNTVASDHNGTLLYALQKRAQSVLTEFWQEKYQTNGPQFYVMHPGWADTQGVKDSLPTFRQLMRPFLRTAGQGIDTIIWLAQTRPRDPSGFWFDRKSRPMHVYGFTRTSSPSPGERLVEFLESFLPEN